MCNQLLNTVTVVVLRSGARATLIRRSFGAVLRHEPLACADVVRACIVLTKLRKCDVSSLFGFLGGATSSCDSEASVGVCAGLR